MIVASGLSHGPRPLAELAQAAVVQALDAAGLTRAEHVLLFLSREFARQPQPAVLAAARAAGTLSVHGCTAGGVLTEQGWQIDQAAAAAMVFSDLPSTVSPNGTQLTFCAQHRLAPDMLGDHPRAGLLDLEGATWANGRLSAAGTSDWTLPGVRMQTALSTGLRTLGLPQMVVRCSGYDLQRLGDLPPGESLKRALPPELRLQPPYHQIVLLRDDHAVPMSILSANRDGSMMLAGSLGEGEWVTWAIRQPLAAEQEMRQVMTSAVNRKIQPEFAIVCSCIGRGPMFYGEDDRDWQLIRESFPGIPLIGAYGSGQIVPLGKANHLFHNAVLTLLCESIHV